MTPGGRPETDHRALTRVALTGGIATGKSQVRTEFARLGIPTVDADELAHAAVAPGTPALAAIVERFGPEVLTPARQLDRRRMAAIVFADPAARKALEGIVHPVVRAATDAWLRGLDPSLAIAVAVVPLLYETGRDADFDLVVTTACEPATQLKRLMERDGLSETEARQRIAAQTPTAEKIRRADYTIRTDGTLEDTARQARAVVYALRGR